MTDERSPDLTQALLLELRAQLEEARRERDECRDSASTSIAALNKSRERWYARWDQATEQIDRLEEQLTTEHACRMHADADLADARLSAEQGVRVAEALAAEKAALVARVGVLSAALKVVHPERLDFDSHSDECMECRSSYSCDSDMEPTPECHQCAHAVLERARSAARAALEVEP